MGKTRLKRHKYKSKHRLPPEERAAPPRFAHDENRPELSEQYHTHAAPNPDGPSFEEMLEDLDHEEEPNE